MEELHAMHKLGMMSRAVLVRALKLVNHDEDFRENNLKSCHSADLALELVK